MWIVSLGISEWWPRHSRGGKTPLSGVAGETPRRPHFPSDTGPQRKRLFREVLRPSPISAKRLCKRRRGQSPTGSCVFTIHAPAAAGWDARCVRRHASISGHRRRGLADGEQSVVLCPIWTAPESTARWHLTGTSKSCQHNWRGLIPGQGRGNRLKETTRNWQEAIEETGGVFSQ